MRRAICACLALLFVGTAHAQQDYLLPDGFMRQLLEPTYGRISRPRDWFFTSYGLPNGWRWLITKEDPKKSPGKDPIDSYETGQRMDVVMYVEQSLQMSNREFAYNFLLQKQKNANVIAECPEDVSENFMRKCLEVIEDKPGSEGRQRQHALYTVYWGFTMNMVVISSFTTPEKNWKNVKSIAEAMSHFEPAGKKPE